MTMTPCKDCPDRHPICHDSCPKYAEYKRQRGAEAAYTREMLDTGKVYHYDHEDRHRERGRKKYMGANGGADRGKYLSPVRNRRKYARHSGQKATKPTPAIFRNRPAGIPSGTFWAMRSRLLRGGKS